MNIDDERDPELDVEQEREPEVMALVDRHIRQFFRLYQPQAKT